MSIKRLPTPEQMVNPVNFNRTMPLSLRTSLSNFAAHRSFEDSTPLVRVVYTPVDIIHQLLAKAYPDYEAAADEENAVTQSKSAIGL